MASAYRDVDIRGLRRAHFNQLRAYVYSRDEECWYYGNREQFEKRHEDLKKWIDSACELFNQSDVVIEKK